MPERHANVLEVLIGQMAQYRDINFVLGKALGVLGHAELFEPVHNLRHRCPALSEFRNEDDNEPTTVAHSSV